MGDFSTATSFDRKQDVGSIELTGITAGYGKKLVLNDVSACLGKGAIVVLIGNNGAGKSTVLKVAVGLLKPWKGKVLLDGQDVTDLPVHARVRRGLALVSQSANTFDSLTVEENLTIGIHGPSRAASRNGLDYALNLLPSLRECLGRRAGLLSGGQRQMLALGIAVAARPAVLLLDEPSAGLSPDRAHEILAKVAEINKASGVSVLMVEQRLKEALAMAHRAVVMVNGSVASQTDRPSDWLVEGALDQFFLGKRNTT